MAIEIKKSYQHSDALEQIENRQVLETLLVDMTALKASMDTLVTKMNADFTAQNSAVTSSQLDVDYVGGPTLTLTA